MKNGICPECSSEEIEGDSVEIEDGEAIQEVTCIHCNAIWYDVYKLTNQIRVISAE